MLNYDGSIAYMRWEVALQLQVPDGGWRAVSEFEYGRKNAIAVRSSKLELLPISSSGPTPPPSENDTHAARAMAQ